MHTDRHGEFCGSDVIRPFNRISGDFLKRNHNARLSGKSEKSPLKYHKTPTFLGLSELENAEQMDT